MSQPVTYLIDASIYIFRSWYSMPDEFSDTDGNPTNAVYGFTGFLCNLMEQVQPELLGLAFDESLTTSYRNEIYPQYKANREPAPEELKRQFAWCREVGEALGVSCFSDPRYEADDLIGTLAGHYREKGHPVCVISADKDLTQLIGHDDYWWDFSRNQKLDIAGVKKKFGVRPDQIPDFLALTGDSVDNIPGIPGIGPKSAVALLQHFDTLDAIWERIDEVPFLSVRGAKSMHAKLGQFRENAELARQLTIIDLQVPSALEQPALTIDKTDVDGINRIFDRLNFGPLLRRRCLNL